MTMISVEKAFSLLGLPSSSSVEEIKQAYRKKTDKHHPDRPDGDDTVQAAINGAYKIALDYVENMRGIVPLRIEKSLKHVDQVIEQQQAFFRAKETAERLSKRKTTKLNRVKFIMLFFGVLVAILALFGKTLLPVFFSEGSEYFKVSKIIFAEVTFVFGIFVIFLQWKVTSIQNRIDAYIEKLSDKKNCASLLAEVLNYTDHNVIDEDNILKVVKNGDSIGGLLPLLSILGFSKSEFYPILLQKSIEHTLLEEMKQDELRPETVSKYKVLFKPSLFKPLDIPEKKPEPMTLSSARAMLITSIVLLLLFGSGTAWLAIVKISPWAVLTGFFSLASMGMLLGAIDSIKEASNRDLKK